VMGETLCEILEGKGKKVDQGVGCMMPSCLFSDDL
jgi:hypothetical protein